MATFDRVEYARNIGRDHGRNAASWFFDGNTDRATFEAFQRGLEEGDPAIEDQLPAADLSGQYADGYTVRDLLADCGVDIDADDEEVDIDELTDAYEEGFADASRADVERQISIRLDGRPGWMRLAEEGK